MFKKSLWFAIVMSLLMVGVNFVDAKGGSSSSSSSGGGGRSSGFSSGSSSGGSYGFSSGSKSTTSSVSVTSGFTSGSKATAPSGFTSGSKSDTAPSSAATSSGKSTDMMSKSVQQERANSVYNAADKPSTAPSSGGSASVNTGGASPGGGTHTVVKETTVIRDSSPSLFPVPIFIGGGGGGSTTVINNSQPTSGTPGYVEVQGTDTKFHDTRSKETRSWAIFFYILGVVVFLSIVYIVIRRSGNR